MAELVADYVLKRLRESGVHRVYGYPGDGINGFLGAFDRADGDPEFIQARHEEMAAFMACGHAKFTDELGVLHRHLRPRRDPPAERPLRRQARPRARPRDRRPAEAHVARRRLPAGGRPAGALQGRLRVRPGLHGARAGAPPDRPRDPHRARQARRRDPHLPGRRPGGEGGRVASARARRGLLQHRLLAPARASARRGPRERGPPCSTRARRSRSSPARARSGASDELIETAELLGAGVAKALLGKDVLPDDLPFVTGSIGLLGTTASYELMNGCDTLLMVGTSFPYSEFLPKEGQARCVEIDIEPSRIGIRYPVDVQLVGDAKETLASAQPEARAQAGPLVARADRDPDRRVVAGGRRPRAPGRRPDEPAARGLGALAAPARGRDRLRRFRLLHELVRARPEAALAAIAPRSRGRSRRWARARRTRSRRSSRTRAAR